MAAAWGRGLRLWLGPAGGRFPLLPAVAAWAPQSRTASILCSWRPAGFCPGGPGQAPGWGRPPARTKARGNEYQPKNLKRKRTHGWIKRIREASGIRVILRRMLKGRKSLSH
ncbi:PREDICTED: 39S ribosomal protein L34, mitochondrial [Crocodylus porosus]|uniref:39S ribosomal protein L34, mitochondrial n=1 Tax=Crocodylus porosus TaxID=8502 RepID=UPI00093A5A47|nr:PREDICTED: 39S ribosomal protein L34, mitochondrial [Crocodylus porosus]XP_019403613.1 PREDICTED: 39S ribosomal protein L34, mitochondrial [Crocodylus porosus]